AFAHNGKGKKVRVGGWGHKVGDEGSGYWIGRKAIEVILKMYDGRLSLTPLIEQVLDYYKFDSLEDFYNWLYSPNCSVDDISSLSKVVDKAREQGDQYSVAIIDEAIHELFQLIVAAVKKAELGQ